MQGVFAPPSPTGTKRDLDGVPRAAPLGAPLVEWEEVTAVPDTEYAGVHDIIPKTVVYSALPFFKIDKYTFFIVPKISQDKNKSEIRLSCKTKWLVPYIAKENNENRWGVPFSYRHQKQIQQSKTEEHKRLAVEIQKTEAVSNTAIQSEKIAREHQNKALLKVKEAIARIDPSFIFRDEWLHIYTKKIEALPVLSSAVLAQLAQEFYDNEMNGKPDFDGDLPQFKAKVTQFLVKIGQVIEKQKDIKKAKKVQKDKQNELKNLERQQIERFLWDEGNEGAAFEPYTVDQAAVDFVIDIFCEEQISANFDINVVYNAAREKMEPTQSLAIAVALSGLHAVTENKTDNLDLITQEFKNAAISTAKRQKCPENIILEMQMRLQTVYVQPFVSTIPKTRKNWLTVLMMFVFQIVLKNKETAKQLMSQFLPEVKKAIFYANPSLQKWYSSETATPFRDYLPANTPNVYEINEEWLRERVENAERWDYEFAVRMQGLSNSSLASVWAPPANNPVFDNGHGVMQRFAETLINHFYDFFVVQEKKDYSPESVIREVVHMHKIFADEWVRQNKNTLSPQLEAMGEAYVSLFFTGPLAALKNTDAALIARLLRRHEKFRGHFGLCLQHYMTKMECDRIGRSPTYKQTNIIANQNMLAVQSMATFLQANLTQIQNELKNEQNATIPEDIVKMFHKYTLDWFRIADQLPPPKSRFPGYTHPEGSDQDPNRQSKWQKVLDHSSRGGKVG